MFTGGGGYMMSLIFSSWAGHLHIFAIDHTPPLYTSRVRVYKNWIELSVVETKYTNMERKNRKKAGTHPLVLTSQAHGHFFKEKINK